MSVKESLNSLGNGSLSRGQLLKDVGDTIAKVFEGSKEFIRKAFRTAFNTRLLRYHKLVGKIPGHLGLLIGAGALVAGVTSFAMGMRTMNEGTQALKMKGNHYGSVWWSYAQTGLHGATIASIVGLALFNPLILSAFPVLPLIPSATALGMDYFQELCTNPNSWMNKLGQFGLDNALVETKNQRGLFVSYRPKLADFWNEKIRAKDKQFAKQIFGFDLDRPEVGVRQSNPGYFLA